MATADKYVINFSDPDKASFSIKAYTSNGPVFPTFTNISDLVTPQPADTSIAVDTSLLIYGRALPNYGERIGENFIHLLENFSGPGYPVAPISGQIWHRVRNYWYDSVGLQWYRYDNDTSSWVTITVGSDITSGMVEGDYSTRTAFPGELFRYTGVDGYNSWVHVASTTDVIAPTLGSPDAIPDSDLVMYDGSDWVNVSGTVTSGPTAPTGPSAGDLWYDTDISDEVGSPTWSYSQLKIYDSIDGFVSVARNYLQKDGDTLQGPLTLNANQMIINTDPVNPTDVVRYGFLSAFGSDDVANDSGVVGVTVTNALDTLDVGKVNVAGDAMTGDLIFDTATPATRDVILSNGAGGPRQFIGYVDNSVAVNKFYVDSVVGAAGDTYIVAAGMGGPGVPTPVGTGSPPVVGSPIPEGDPNTLYLEYSTGATPLEVPELALTTHTHNAVEIVFAPFGDIVATNVQEAIEELEVEKASLDSPTFSGDVYVSGTLTLTAAPTSNNEAATKQYVDDNSSNIRRVILAAAGSPAIGPYTVPRYEVGRNQTFVTVAGLKQYQSVKGYQTVQLLTSVALTDTGLANSIEVADPTLDRFVVSNDQTARFVVGLSFEVVDSTSGLNDGTYTVLTNSTLTAESSTVGAIAESGGSPSNLDGTYFTISTPTEEFYVWMDVDAGGNDPVPGFGTAVPVSISSGDDAATVASAIETALTTAGSPNDFTVSTTGSPATTVLIENNDVGAVISSILEGGLPTGFNLNQVVSGGNTIIPTVEAVPVADTVGLVSPSYSVDIDIDGGGAQTIIVAGEDAKTYTTLVDLLTSNLTGGFVALSTDDASITVTSDTYAGSSVNITDAVFAGSPASELPLFASLLDYVSILPAVGGATYGYQEVGTGNSNSTTILFESDPGPGIIEVLVY